MSETTGRVAINMGFLYTGFRDEVDFKTYKDLFEYFEPDFDSFIFKRDMFNLISLTIIPSSYFLIKEILYDGYESKTITNLKNSSFISSIRVGYTREECTIYMGGNLYYNVHGKKVPYLIVTFNEEISTELSLNFSAFIEEDPRFTL